MRKKPFCFTHGGYVLLYYTVVFLSAMFSVKALLAEQGQVEKQSKEEAVEHIKKLQIPFIANDGQTDERVKYYANTFLGTVFVTKNSEIVYLIPGKDEKRESRNQRQEASSEKADAGSRKSENRCVKSGSNPQSAIQNRSSAAIEDSQSEIITVFLRESLVGGKIAEIKGEEKAVTNVSYFKGKDPSKWKTNISTYEMVNLGEVYNGIELKLKAYGNNVEKLFCVKPDANPDQIWVNLSGAKGLRVNDEGQLVVETEFGAVKFTKPIAYQEIDGKRVNVEVEYSIQRPEDGKQKQEARSERQEARGKRLISGKEKGMGRKAKYLASCLQLPILNFQLKTQNQKLKTYYLKLTNPLRIPQLEYGFKVASYDKTKDLIIDPLLASTFLGGSSQDIVNQLALDTSGNVYVTGYAASSDFPTTTGAYDTSFNDSDSSYSGDIFVSKVNGDLTSLLASTYLGGSSSDDVNSIAIDIGGNIYVAGWTRSVDFPTTIDAYDTSYNGGGWGGDAFLSKLSGDLTSLLASTYFGGTKSDYVKSIVTDTGENIYVTGHTESSDFPITTGTFIASYNGGYNDAFVSCLNGDLTSLFASTYLGGTNGEGGNSIVIDSGGNIYVAGWTTSANFPTTDAYDISYNYTVPDSDGDEAMDVFVSKLSGDLTNLVASTYLGGYSRDDVYSITVDSSDNVYVAGHTYSSDFPTTTGAYDISRNGIDAFVSKLSGDLIGLLASTYLGGSSSDFIWSTALDSDGNIYVTGGTSSSDFPTTTGVYDTSYNGGDWGGDAFVSKLNKDLTSVLASTFLGGLGSDDVGNSIATDSGGNIYVAGYTYSIDFPATTGAYDTSYNGYCNAFVSKFDSNLSTGGDVVPAPTPSPRPSSTPRYPPTPTLLPLPTPISTLTTEPSKKCIISGYVIDKRDNPVESAKLRLKGVNSKVFKKTISDEDGVFEFTDLDADTYTVTALKKGYKTVKQTITLEEGEEEDIEIVMKRTGRR